MSKRSKAFESRNTDVAGKFGSYVAPRKLPDRFFHRSGLYTYDYICSNDRAVLVEITDADVADLTYQMINIIGIGKILASDTQLYRFMMDRYGPWLNENEVKKFTFILVCHKMQTTTYQDGMFITMNVSSDPPHPYFFKLGYYDFAALAVIFKKRTDAMLFKLAFG